MYCEYFGLKELPFRITPDTRFFHSGGNRGAVLEAVVYAITRGEGIIKVIGEVGSGKTMLCRMLEVSLPEQVEVLYLANPRLHPDDVPEAIAVEMGLPGVAGADRLQVIRALQEELLAKHADGRHVVLFIEEAQSMPLETLEEIRLLSNLETQQCKLLQMVLFGQPELEQRLAVTEIRQLRERITQSFELDRFGAWDVQAYLDFRLRTVGYGGRTVFSPFAVWQMARSSRGLIRRVNILADKALLAAYASGAKHVTVRHVHAAARDSEFRKNHRRWRLALASTATAVVLIASALVVSGLMGNPPVQSHRRAADMYWMRLDDALAFMAIDASSGTQDSPTKTPASDVSAPRDLNREAPYQLPVRRDSAPRPEALGE